jgi:hypothetical protein
MMTTWIRKNWRRISTVALVAALGGIGASEVYRAVRGDCCQPGAPCCYPGSPCCKGHGAHH